MHDHADSATVRSEFVNGLVNAHALEQQARELIERQLDRVRNYPELAAKLRQHLKETEDQMRRLDRILDSLDESPSGLKDFALSVAGNLSAMMNAPASDEILKNTFSSVAFENYEAAAYRSLIAMAEMGSYNEAGPMLKQSLAEEEAMAEWLARNVDPPDAALPRAEGRRRQGGSVKPEGRSPGRQD